MKSRHDATYRAKHGAKLTDKRHTDAHRYRANAAAARRYHTDLEFRLTAILRAGLAQAIRLHGEAQKSTSVIKLIGCTVPALMAHLQSLWMPWMCWGNYGRRDKRNDRAWVIDHRKPCAAFDLTDVAQQAECFHWSNLRPLCRVENSRKGARLDWTYSRDEDENTI